MTGDVFVCACVCLCIFACVRVCVCDCAGSSSCMVFIMQVELPPADLGPTSSLTKMLQLLQDILSSHDSSVVAPDERKTAFAQVRCTLCF